MLKLILSQWLVNKLGVVGTIAAGLGFWFGIVLAALIIAYVQTR